MKFLIVTLALVAFVAADVSHLNNEYLPPHMASLVAHKHVEYAQQSQEIPQVSAVEITDNSVAAEQGEDQQYYTGKINIDNVNYGPGYAGDIQASGQEGAVAATSSSVESSVAAPGSDTFTQQQAAYYTSISAQGNQAAAGASVSSTTVVEEQAQEPEQKYYTGLVYKPGQETAASAPVAEEDAQAAVIPGSDEATQQQAAQHEHEYHTGLVYNPGQEASDSTSVAEQEPEQQYHTGLVYKQGQEQYEAAPALGSSSGIDTQYGSNGGYVY